MRLIRLMKYIELKTMKTKAIYFIVALVVFGCTRDEEVLPNATFPKTAEIFTDVPVSLTDEFFVSFDPAAGANTNGFGVDENEFFEGTASIRIDVPSVDDPDGSFIGGIFLDRGDGRNLTDYNALTFYAKASFSLPAGSVDFGFGSDFEQDRYAAGISTLLITSGWKKYTIPIPDPSKLVQEKGMFLFSAGTGQTNGIGYTMWIDEIRFENTSSVAQPLAQIANGEDTEFTTFNGVTIPIAGASVIYNVDGTDVGVTAAPAYFNFETSDPSIASVSDDGVITINQEGTAVITASLGEGSNELSAEGSITVTSIGDFIFAPEPPARDPGDVISLFSDAYTNVPVSRYNSFFAPFQTTLGGVVPILDQEFISYTELNFVGIVFGDDIFPAEAVPELDLTDFDRFHIDINVREELQAGDRILFELTDYNGGGAGSFTINASDLVSNGWASIDVPLSNFLGLTSRSEIGLLLFNSSETISEIYIDNIYFYKE